MARISGGIILVLISVVGFAINTFTLHVLLRLKKKRKGFSINILCILLLNILQSVITTPAFALQQFDWSITVEKIICDIFSFTYFFCMHGTTYSILLITLDLVIRLANPFLYTLMVNRKLKFIIAILWTLIIIFDIIPFFYPPMEYCHYAGTREWFLTMHVIFNCLAYCIFLPSWVYIARVSLSHYKRIKSLNLSFKSYTVMVNSKTLIIKVKAAKMALGLLLGYLICYVPAALLYILKHTCYQKCFIHSYRQSKSEYDTRFAFKVLVLLYMFITPLIFCWRRKIFRNFRMIGKSAQILPNKKKTKTSCNTFHGIELTRFRTQSNLETL